ncbi:MAG: DUF3040 domain-containing protein [Propionibacteriaceae bacterium]|nr:DUF3040 domain-containing protein [Propionibacteriaceae bacterium]
MALSKEEERLLAELQASLEADDPKLASTLRGNTVKQIHTRRAALAGLAFLVGIAALISGMQIHFALSVVGFVIMFAATVIAISAWQFVDDTATPKPTRIPKNDPLMDRLSQRWNKRQDDGL